jgi:hypothetical protein
MMTEGFKPLYPAMCVLLRYLHRCRHGAKFKSAESLFFLKKISFPQQMLDALSTNDA